MALFLSGKFPSPDRFCPRTRKKMSGEVSKKGIFSVARSLQKTVCETWHGLGQGNCARIQMNHRCQKKGVHQGDYPPGISWPDQRRGEVLGESGSRGVSGGGTPPCPWGCSEGEGFPFGMVLTKVKIQKYIKQMELILSRNRRRCRDLCNRQATS